MPLDTHDNPLTGRPTDYSDEIGEAICELIAMGYTIKQICLMPHINVSDRSVYRWLVKQDTFRQMYVRAREHQAERFAEEIIEIADDGSNDWMERELANGNGTELVINHDHIARSRLRVDTRKWLMSKQASHKYGDNKNVNVTGTVNLQSIVEATMTPALPTPGGPVIDITPDE